MDPPRTPAEVIAYNRRSWNRQSREGSEWATPVDTDTIARARHGDFRIFLIPQTPVPREWFGESDGKRILWLASGGGQQVPVLAAAGAEVTSLDNSNEQLSKDRMVCRRENLPLETVLGDMCDLSVLPDDHFDIVFNPVSNVFILDVNPIGHL